MFAPVLRAGVVYSVEVPIAKPGLYQVRTAVGDAGSRRLGSASDVVEVPDLRAGKLALSGLVVGAAEQLSRAEASQGVGAAEEETAGTLPVTADTDGTPAVRRFRPGATLGFALAVYNARTDKSSGRPDVAVQVSLYREDLLVVNLPAPSASLSRAPDQRGLAAAGFVELPATIAPGYYTLAVTATDRLAGKKDATAVQWTELEVVSPGEVPEARASAEGPQQEAPAAR
jgi:hypothetical protein